MSQQIKAKDLRVGDLINVPGIGTPTIVGVGRTTSGQTALLCQYPNMCVARYLSNDYSTTVLFRPEPKSLVIERLMKRLNEILLDENVRFEAYSTNDGYICCAIRDFVSRKSSSLESAIEEALWVIDEA
jgi:hypothetical protein